MNDRELQLEDLPPIRKGGAEKTEAMLRRRAYNSYMAGEARIALPDIGDFLREHPPLIIDLPTSWELRAEMNTRFLSDKATVHDS